MSEDYKIMCNVIKNSKIPHVIVSSEDSAIHYIAIEDVMSGAIIAFQFGIGDQLIDAYLADAVHSLKEFELAKD